MCVMGTAKQQHIMRHTSKMGANNASNEQNGDFALLVTMRVMGTAKQDHIMRHMSKLGPNNELR